MKIGDVEKPKSQDQTDDKEPEPEESKISQDEDEPQPGPSTAPDQSSKNELSEELELLIRSCRKAEKSDEMKTIIKKKLLKYYHSVHPDYVMSKTFLKLLKSTAEDILRDPTLVFSKLKVVLEELSARRNSKFVVVVPKAPEATESEPAADAEAPEVVEEAKSEVDIKLKKLTKGLKFVKRKIEKLEEAEVDWDEDDNSTYLQKARLEKRACEIYEKICELTGESRTAHRTVKNPISFKGTEFREFNKILEKLVNDKRQFPNFRDVLKRLDLCNRKHGYRLGKEEQKTIAQDAFLKLGKMLQQRRKSDLYETATYYAGKSKDPARDDPELRVQLEKNKKNYARLDEIINL